MTGHVHAELMAQYAEDARETNTPWDLWEEKQPHKFWVDCNSHPCWYGDTAYRRKPKTSRERFDVWCSDKFGFQPNKIHTSSALWATWQEAERQVRELDE